MYGCDLGFTILMHPHSRRVHIEWLGFDSHIRSIRLLHDISLYSRSADIGQNRAPPKKNPPLGVCSSTKLCAKSLTINIKRLCPYAINAIKPLGIVMHGVAYARIFLSNHIILRLYYIIGTRIAHATRSYGVKRYFVLYTMACWASWFAPVSVGLPS